MKMKSLSQRVPRLAVAIAAALVLSLGFQPVSPAVASGPVLSLPEGDRAIAMWCNTDELMGFLFEIDMASGTTDRDANRVGTWQRPTDTDQIVIVDNSDPDNPVTTTRSAYGLCNEYGFQPCRWTGLLAFLSL